MPATISPPVVAHALNASGSAICIRTSLLDAIELAAKVVNPRSPKPVLTCARIVAAGDAVTVSATDLETAVVCRTVKVQIEHPFDVAVPAEQLAKVLRGLADETVTIRVGPASIEVLADRSKFTIATMDVSTFPGIAEGRRGEAAVIATDSLRRLIRQSRAAADPSSKTYPGTLVEVAKNNVAFVATEGHVLAESTAACECGEGFSAVIPHDVFSLVEKAISFSKEVSVYMGGTRIVFDADDFKVTSVTIEGRFVPYRDFIPKDADKRATAVVEGFLGIVRQVLLVVPADAVHKGARFSFSKEDGIRARFRSESGNAAEASMPLKFEGDPIEIGFNAKWASAGLRAMDRDEMTVDLSSPNRPAVFRAGPDFMFLIMPVNLQ